ncbi:hypothetical protein [Azospirillum largimobile]
MLALLFVLIALPYAIVAGIIQEATYNGKKRKDIKKNIIIFFIPAIYTTTIDRNVFIEQWFISPKDTIALFGDFPLIYISYAAGIYMAFQFIKIGFFNGVGNFSIFKFAGFTLFLYGSFIYGMANYNKIILGYRLPVIWMMIVGFMYFSFIAGIHAVFPKIILASNVFGFAASYFSGEKLYIDDYFLVLELFPEVSGVVGLIIVLASTFCSAYSFGVEKGWLRHLEFNT